MIKMSNTSKMPCKSWSLEAIATCPASLKPDGDLVDACAICYANKGTYRFKNVKAARQHNREDWKRDDWCEDMIKTIGDDPYFRWFDSGDMYSLRLASKMSWVMQFTPKTKPWLPTRMSKFDKFDSILKDMANLPNVVVRWSSDSIDGNLFDVRRGLNRSTIIPKGFRNTEFLDICPSSKQDGKCGDCRKCWDKMVFNVAYVLH